MAETAQSIWDHQNRGTIIACTDVTEIRDLIQLDSKWTKWNNCPGNIIFHHVNNTVNRLNAGIVSISKNASTASSATLLKGCWRPSSLLGFCFCYNNPHLSNAGRVRTQISTFDNRISWLSHSRYWCNTLELPKTLQKSVLDSGHCVFVYSDQEVFCLLQWSRRGKLSESQTKGQGTQKNWKFQCSIAEKTEWSFSSCCCKVKAKDLIKKKEDFSNGFCN